MQTAEATPTKPNGPVAAVYLAAGIGSLVFGLLVVLNEVSADINNFLKFDENFGLGSGVGALSGKAILGTVALVVSWLVLHLVFRGKEVKFGPILVIALVLVGAGFLLTFPPVFELFLPAEA
jgi:hypothetical protein